VSNKDIVIILIVQCAHCILSAFYCESADYLNGFLLWCTIDKGFVEGKFILLKLI